MNVTISLAHYAIVFLIPSAFGWLVLRRFVREHDWLVLVPGSFVAGLAALMTLVNEARHYLEMPVALWTVYRVLLGGILVILLGSRPPRAPATVRRDGRRFWRLCLLAAGAVICGIYYGIPAWHGVLDDAWWGHYPIATEILTEERFPLHHIMALDHPLYYHYGPDIVAAAWSSLLGISVQRAYALMIICTGPAVFLLGTALVLRFSRRFWCGLIGGMMAVAGGNLRFLFLVGAHWSDPISVLQALNSQTVQGLNQLIFTPSHALGVPILFLTLAVFRHFQCRPSLKIASVLGLMAGSLSLVAEWYFVPFLAASTLWLLRDAWRRRETAKGFVRFAALSTAPLVIALFCGIFNDSYFANAFGQNWMRFESMPAKVMARELTARLAQEAQEARELAARLAREASAAPMNPGLAGPASVGPGALPIPPALGPSALPPAFVLPIEPSDLVPLQLNLRHLGEVPTWRLAGSKGNPYVSIASPQVLAECFPVLLLGLPLGFAWAWRRRMALPATLALISLISILPPTLLDWSFRSVDFLRFFTGAFTCGALLFGWVVGTWMKAPRRATRAAGWALTAAGLVNPVAFGVLGLMPSTISTVKAVAFQAASLSTFEAGKLPRASASSLLSPDRAFEQLATQAGDFLFPLTRGRERALVLVSPQKLPPLATFPEWLKFPTLARMPVPVGWYWERTAYSEYYRLADTTLSSESLVALDIRWIVLTNVFGDKIPRNALTALKYPERFSPAFTFRSGPYFLAVYRVNR